MMGIPPCGELITTIPEAILSLILSFSFIGVVVSLFF